MSSEWLSARVEYLRGLKAPSEQQRLLLLLAEKSDRTTDDERKLAALVRAESVAGLLILGGLVDSKRGTPTMDRGELLGALASLSKVPADDPRRAEWKKTGDKLLAGK